MKQYFAKYLPVEGEIKDGNLYQTEWGERYNYFEYLNYEPKGKLLKLFLCSRDIQVGERAYCLGEEAENRELGLKEGDRQWVNPWCIKGNCPDCVKVIGEISPEATWVKEGAEFDEEEIESKKVGFYNGTEVYFDTELQEDAERLMYKEKIIFKILCPTCKHFH